MTFSEIAKAIEAGKMKLDACDHCINTGSEGRIVERFHRDTELAAGSNDGKWKNYDQDTNNLGEFYGPENDAEMRKCYKRGLEQVIEINDPYGVRDIEAYCFNCGRELRWVYDGSDTLKLRGYWDPELSDKVLMPEGQHCEFKTPKPFVGQINVQSELIFANFFRVFEDEPKGSKYSREYSLNCLSGRAKISEFKAKEHNVAYGQMGNMSVSIHVSKDLKSIIVGEAYDANFKGYKRVGPNLSLAVWRFEATDKKTLGQENFDALVKDMEERCQEIIVLDVPHGDWKFEHFYDTRTSKNKHIYAKFTFVPKEPICS